MSERPYPQNKPVIGTNIKRLRKMQQMKAVDVIARLNLLGIRISTSTFCKVENGLNNPSADLLIRLTEIFHCDYNEFFKTK